MQNWHFKKLITCILFFFLLMSLNSARAGLATKKAKACDCAKLSKRLALLTAATDKKPLQMPPQMVWIPPGIFMMGGHDKDAKSDELPVHQVKLKGFYMDATEVTNEQFAQFVKATKYITTAEKPVDWELLKQQVPLGTPKPSADKLKPGSLVFTPPDYLVSLDEPNQWWQWVNGADWHHPLGPDSKIFGSDHPVVQVSFEDAVAFCQWMGKRLPTEAEREWAARGDLANKIYPWGDMDIESDTAMANIWQGRFPSQNTLKDHYYWTSPVAAFPPNGYGLYDMAGNVWEWTADLYDARYYSSLKKQGLAIDPQGSNMSYDPDEPGVKKYVLRGGSFLCNKIYCTGYRVSARMKSTPDTSLVNVGFRCVKDKG